MGAIEISRHSGTSSTLDPDESTSPPGDSPTKQQATEEPTKESIKQATKQQATEEPTKEPIKQATEEPINRPTLKPMNEPLNEIYNLMEIRLSPHLSVALEDWESTEQDLIKRLDSKEKAVRNTRNEVTMMTGFSFAVQGLLLTAAAVSSSSQCKNLYFLLAVSASVTFWALAFVWHKEVTIRRLRSVIVQDQVIKKGLRTRLERLKQEGTSFDFEGPNNYVIKSTKVAPPSFGFPLPGITWVSLPTTTFGALCLVAIDRLLCHSS